MMHYKKSPAHFYKNNRLRQWRNLLFFVVVVLAGSCHSKPGEINITWKNNKATAIAIPDLWIRDIPKDSFTALVQITAAPDKNKTPVLGDYRQTDRLLFEPVVPFSRGTEYIIWIRNRMAGQFTVPFENGDGPKVIATYPQADTVPENLLKIYIRFSHPMSEGHSADYITLVKNDRDTLHNVFLDLQPELWNEDRTVLTLWLDPGRIKRDLQPNLRLGAPLQVKEKYRFTVLKNWKDAQGRALQENHGWTFVTHPRNERSPDPSQWKVSVPKASSKEALVIAFDQPLDHFLLPETIHLNDASGKMVKFNFEAADKDRSCRLTPIAPWAAGKYTVVIDSKLEDLAGNNLNRPFDRDVTKTKQPSTQPYHTISFTIVKQD